jgi:hypothetical protein
MVSLVMATKTMEKIIFLISLLSHAKMVTLSPQDTFKLNNSNKSNNIWKTSLRIIALTMFSMHFLTLVVINTINTIIMTITILTATMEMMLSL